MQILCIQWLPGVWNITKCWVSTLDAFAAAACLQVFLPSVLSSVREVCSVELGWGDWLHYLRTFYALFKNISFLCFKGLWGCFCSMFWVIIHLWTWGLSYQFCSCTKKYSFLYFRMNPAASIRSYTILQFHWQPYSLAVTLPPWCLYFYIINLSFSILFPIMLMLILVSSFQKILCSNNRIAGCSYRSSTPSVASSCQVTKNSDKDEWTYQVLRFVHEM